MALLAAIAIDGARTVRRSAVEARDVEPQKKNSILGWLKGERPAEGKESGREGVNGKEEKTEKGTSVGKEGQKEGRPYPAPKRTEAPLRVYRYANLDGRTCERPNCGTRAGPGE